MEKAQLGFIPVPWNVATREALRDTFHSELGERRIAQGVRCGDFEAWTVYLSHNDEPSHEIGTLVTERLNDELFVWCYQGREYFSVSKALAVAALGLGLHHVGWFTFHKGAARRYRHLAPTIMSTGIAGEMRFRIRAEALIHGR